jgi:hypothetical protein
MSRVKVESGITQHTATEEDAVMLPALSAATVELERNKLMINQQYGLEPFNQDRVEAEIALHSLKKTYSTAIFYSH